MQTIVNFCTNDYRFFDRCIAEVKTFSQKIFVVVCDHFFDGTPESFLLLHDLYARYPECTFIQYAYSDKLYSRFVTADELNWKMYWYSTSRYIGYLYADADYLLFLDIDEIVAGKRFKRWLDTGIYQNYDALRFLAYFYFRKSNLQAKTWPPNALLAKRSALNHSVIFNDWDRYGTYSRIQGNKMAKMVGLDHKPLIHHYSWTKPKEECLKKSVTSGHHWEMDFKTLIEKEFSKEEQGADFAFSYEYKKVKPFFDPLAFTMPETFAKKETYPNVILVDRDSVFRREIELEFNLGDVVPGSGVSGRAVRS